MKPAVQNPSSLMRPWIVGLKLTRNGRPSDYYVLWYEENDIIPFDMIGIDSNKRILLAQSQRKAFAMYRYAQPPLSKFGAPRRNVNHVVQFGELLYILETGQFTRLVSEIDLNITLDMFATLGFPRDSWQRVCLGELANRIFEDGSAQCLQDDTRQVEQVSAALREAIAHCLAGGEVV